MSLLNWLRDRTSRPAACRRRSRRAPRDPSRRQACRLRLEPLEHRLVPSANVVLQWNEVLVQTLLTPGAQPASIPVSPSPAIMHAAIYDAVNSIDGSYTPYAPKGTPLEQLADLHAPPGASAEAAAAQAAHDTLVALYPLRQAAFDAALAQSLEGIPPGHARLGIQVGQAVAQAILTWRSTDGADHPPLPYDPGPDPAPGVYRLTPPNLAKPQNTHWPQITPYTLT